MNLCRLLFTVAFIALPYGCGSSNPEKPLSPAAEDSIGSGGAISLAIPIPKALVVVVERVVATLDGPGIQTIIKELTVTPLGPATGIIGALPASTGLTLTLEGYDLDGLLLFNGQRRGIAIAAGDTTRITVELLLVQDISIDDAEPADPEPADPEPADPEPADPEPAEESETPPEATP